MWYRAYTPNFKAIGRYFEMEDFEGGNAGVFRKIEKKAVWVFKHGTCVQNFPKIGKYLYEKKIRGKKVGRNHHHPSSSSSPILEVVFVNFGQS